MADKKSFGIQVRERRYKVARELEEFEQFLREAYEDDAAELVVIAEQALMRVDLIVQRHENARRREREQQKAKERVEQELRERLEAEMAEGKES